MFELINLTYRKFNALVDEFITRILLKIIPIFKKTIYLIRGTTNTNLELDSWDTIQVYAETTQALELQVTLSCSGHVQTNNLFHVALATYLKSFNHAVTLLVCMG